MYKRITKSVNEKGKLISINDIENTIEEFVNSNDNSDYYLSVYMYNEEQFQKFKQTGSIAGIKEVITDKVYLDFDTKEDLETARQSTIKAVQILKDNGWSENSIDIAFSGNKGFSVVANIDYKLTPEEHKTLATNLFGHLPGFDESIYNASRIFRIPNTKHQDSGLFKIQISETELETRTVGAIKTRATTKKEYIKKTEKLNPDNKIKNLMYVEPKVKESNNTIKVDLDFSKKPTYLTDTKYVLHQGYIPPGKGNTGMMILASTYKHVNFTDVEAYRMLKTVNERRAQIYGPSAKRSTDEIWLNVIKTVYGPNWNGGTYKTEETELLKQVAETHNIIENSKNIVAINDVKNRFTNFAQNINSNIIKTGLKSLDEKTMITTGMLVGVLGSPGSGKTSFASSFAENLSIKGINSLFFSLDMHDNLLYSRLIQKSSDINVQNLLRQMVVDDKTFKPGYNINEDKDFLNAAANVADVYKNVDFNFNRGSTIESIEEDIRVCKNKYGSNFKLVVVDYLEKIKSGNNDPTVGSGIVAGNLSNLASKYDICILLLLQPQKSAGDASEELLSMRKVKGASVIEQDCRVIMTMWRPGFNPSDNHRDKYASIAVVKNNMGEVCKEDFYWNGIKGKLSELDHEGRQNLKQLIEDKEALKKQKEDESW